MTNEERTYKKWESAFSSRLTAATGFDNKMSYDNSSINDLSINSLTSGKNSSEFPSALPFISRVTSKVISKDLVTVQPLESQYKSNLEKIKTEVKIENRERKIDSLIQNKEFEEMKIEEHPDYKTGPKSELFYLDFTYATATN